MLQAVFRHLDEDHVLATVRENGTIFGDSDIADVLRDRAVSMRMDLPPKERLADFCGNPTYLNVTIEEI